MSHTGDSTKVIVVAFLANLGIALAKFVGAFISGSASLLAEAIHSTVDCSNQILLLVGSKKSQKPPDERHPLGYGREAFFWSFIVAILLFSLGGLFAIYEGVHKLHGDQQEVSSPIIGLAILVFGFVLEAYSFYACLKEVRSQKNFDSLWQWFRESKSSELLVIFTEDAAALTGLFVAAICLGLAWITGNPSWDALGSIFVGSILVVVAILLAVEIKSFLIGESPGDDLKLFVQEETKRVFATGRVLNLIALQTGSHEVMLSFKVDPGQMTNLDDAINKVNQLERTIRANFPVVKWQFVELDRED
jgi:cation diffusion facilitator family transporter